MLSTPIAMKKILIIIVSVILVVVATAGCFLVKPFVVQKKTTFGYDLEKVQDDNISHIERLQAYIAEHGDQFDGLVINVGNTHYFSSGRIDKSTNLASVRKSLISLLYGIAQEKQLVKLNKTLADLGIDEPHHPLTDIEKTATIRDLLMARSGIYIESGAESTGMKNRRPQRGEYKPGEHFYYNNWDFNVLGFIFEQETGLNIGEALLEWLAKPLGMQDFDVSHVVYAKSSDASQYPVWRIYMSARDLARIGSLLLEGGRWKGLQLIPAEWIRESTIPYSKTSYEDTDGYGYLWWIDTDRKVYIAIGSGGQYLLVDDAHNFCISLRKDTGVSIAGMLVYRWLDKETPQSVLFALYAIMAQE